MRKRTQTKMQACGDHKADAEQRPLLLGARLADMERHHKAGASQRHNNEQRPMQDRGTLENIEEAEEKRENERG